jgi:hypothetical protein
VLACYQLHMELIGIVEDGVVRLPPQATLPEGARVRVVYEPAADQPFDREPVSETDVLADIAWARGDRFR